MSDDALQRLLADACLEVAPDDDPSALVDALVARYDLPEEDARALRAMPARLSLYRTLVRNTLGDVVFAMLRRTHARAERVSPGLFANELSAFLASVGPKSPYLRDVPHDFAAWLAPRLRARATHAWLADSAAYELAEYTVSAAEEPEAPAVAEVSLDAPLVFRRARALVRLESAVHRMADTDEAPVATPATVLVYRDDGHAARFLELSPLAATIVEALFDGAPLSRALEQACARHGTALDDTVLAGAARLLSDLGERGLLLGARAA
jgi:hypothetical protein